MTPTDRTDHAARVRLPDPEIHVPAGESPAAVCSHCGRPFRSEHARDLHVGEHHRESASAAERDRYDEALETERDDLWLYHAKAVIVLGVTYSMTVILYMVVLGSGLL
jgi:hypothetical protein